MRNLTQSIFTNEFLSNRFEKEKKKGEKRREKNIHNDS